MTIRFFRPLTALGLAAAITAAGIGAAQTPDLQFNRAPVAPDLQFALQFNAAPATPDLMVADFLDAAPVAPDLQFALQFNAVPVTPEVQGAEVPDATPDLQFC